MEEMLFFSKDVLRQGGFNLTKFLCNDVDVMKRIEEGDRSKDYKLSSRVTKVLGVRWNFDEDKFHFKINVPDQTTLTRRSMLQTVASIYDPMGLISPSVLSGRILVQETTRLKLGWDQEIPKDIQLRWISWMKKLENVNQLQIKRCFTYNDSEVLTYQLHHFSDASLVGYGCVSYLRIQNKDGSVEVSMVYSKSRVSPIKQVTIPRLELMAATLSVKSDITLRRELGLPLEDSVFWTDSKIVLAYICDTSKRYQMFVANKIETIRSNSALTQWHHISGTENSAYIASRGADPLVLKTSNWFTGPDILFQKAKDWPTLHIEPGAN